MPTWKNLYQLYPPHCTWRRRWLVIVQERIIVVGLPPPITGEEGKTMTTTVLTEDQERLKDIERQT